MARCGAGPWHRQRAVAPSEREEGVWRRLQLLVGVGKRDSWLLVKRAARSCLCGPSAPLPLLRLPQLHSKSRHSVLYPCTLLPCLPAPATTRLAAPPPPPPLPQLVSLGRTLGSQARRRFPPSLPRPPACPRWPCRLAASSAPT